MQIQTILNSLKARVPSLTSGVLGGLIGAASVQHCPADAPDDVTLGDSDTGTSDDGEGDDTGDTDDGNDSPVLFDVLPPDDGDSDGSGQPALCCACVWPDSAELGDVHDCLVADVTWTCDAVADGVWLCDDVTPITCVPALCDEAG